MTQTHENNPPDKIVANSNRNASLFNHFQFFAIEDGIKFVSNWSMWNEKPKSQIDSEPINPKKHMNKK